MNAQQLTKLRQKQANVYIGRPQPVDASLQTWKVQARAAGAGNVVPVVVPNRSPNQGTGVMEFVNTKDTIPCATGGTGVQTTATGRGTHGEYFSVLMKAAGCAVCSDPNPATNPGGVTLPCCPYEPRQRYYITNSAGDIVDYNTYITNLDAGPQCVACQGQQFNDQGRPINCSCATTNIYGGGGIAATTVNKTGMRLKFSSA
jgi:hypothetical protein